MASSWKLFGTRLASSLALVEINEDDLAIQDAVDSWRKGEPGTPLSAAFRQVREAGSGGIQE